MNDYIELIKESGPYVVTLAYFIYKDITITNKLKESLDKMNNVMAILVDRCSIKVSN
jgi:hypothetical protein